MGIEFRGSESKKDVHLGKRTVKDGEAVAVWDMNGKHTQIIGPKLVRLFCCTINFLDRKTASPTEYLKVTNADGTVEHIKGPISLYENPVFHMSIEVNSSINIPTAADCIVVHRDRNADYHTPSVTTGTKEAIVNSDNYYKPVFLVTPSQVIKDIPNDRNNSVERLIFRGPFSYFPAVGDTIATFAWSHCNVKKTNILRTGTRAWNVDAPVLDGKVSLGFWFSVEDVEKMLNRTSDLTGDLYDALIVDLCQVSPSLAGDGGSVDTLLSGGTFSDLSTFATMLAFAASTGIILESVSFRGFEHSAEMKKNLEIMREVESKLARDRVKAEQEEWRIAADLKARQARLQQEHDLEAAVLAGKNASLDAQQEFQEKQMRYENELAAAKLQAQLEHHKSLNDETLRVLSGLKGLDVDITKLLCESSHTKRTSDERATLVDTVPGLNKWFTVPSGGPALNADGVKKW